MATAAFATKVTGYSRPRTVVSAEWVREHLADPFVRIVEVDDELGLYEAGHIPGAIKLDWRAELQDSIRRDIVHREDFDALMCRKGVRREMTVVLYGDGSNRFAAHALWIFKLYGHDDVRIMDGGRSAWNKNGHPWTRDVDSYPPTEYSATSPNLTLRAFRDAVFCQMEAGRPLIDARSPAEYGGELMRLPRYPREEAQRGGHIPGAKNIPWSSAASPVDGTFKGASELRGVYQGEHGVWPDEEVITYCRIGECSSYTWFVLTHLLGYPRVKSYDGSWMEWGNLIAAPIEK